MARPQRGVAATVDTNVGNVDRFSQMSPQSLSQTASPVGSLLASPPVSPEPAYIASREAGQIITREVLLEFHQVEEADLADTHESSLSQISDSALVTVNHFLDRILHNVLATSRSLSLANLRSAVKDVLKPRLAAEAIGGADEELIECIGEDDEVDLFEDATETMDGSFDLDLIWRRARLRCMVYTRLGDMEEDDEERYIEEHSLDGFVDGRRMSRNNGLVSPPVAIWLTAILEFIGENALMISSQSAYKRCETRYGRGLAGQPLHPSVVTVSDGDLEKIALNPTLGRLWRAWRKPLKSPRPSISRALSVESMRHRRGDSRSSVNFGRKASSETLSSLRESVPVLDEREQPSEMVRKDSLAEEPEAEAAEQEPEAVAAEVVPAEIPLPVSQYDVDEIEVPGYDPDPDLGGRDEESLAKSKRPTSMAFPGDSESAKLSETIPPRGPRHMRSQSLPGARRPSVYALLEENQSTVTGTPEGITTTALRDGDRPDSDLSQPEVFSSLQSPADYQTPAEETFQDKQKSTRRNRTSAVPLADRKSGVSEVGSDGPVLFDRSDYRVDPNEIPAVPTTLLSPQVTAATPTDMPGTPLSAPVRSGLRSNRPVSLAIGKGSLAAPGAATTGAVSPMAEGEYMGSGEVSPLEPSDDEGSVLIAGLKDAKEHMGVDPSGSDSRDSDAPFEDAPEEPAVSPISPPVGPPSHVARTWVEPPAPQPRREPASATMTPTAASRLKQDVPMVRQISDERRREAALSPNSVRSSVEKEELPDIPKEEQIKALAAAELAHKRVEIPQPKRLYESIYKDVTDDEIPPGGSAASTTGAAPATKVTLLSPPATQPGVSSPQSSSPLVIETATTATRIHRREVPQEAKQELSFQPSEPKAQPKYQQSETRSQGPAAEARGSQQDTWDQHDARDHVLGGVTPLNLRQSSPTDAAVAPPASKLLERRRQLPQVDTTTSEKSGVHRLTTSPQSAEAVVKQLPPRNVPENVYAPPVPPPVARETTPPAMRRPAARQASKSGDDVFGHKATKSRNSSNERSKDFEQLIDSGETIQYTLTPQNIRSYQAAEAAPESVPMQASGSRDRQRGLSFGTKSRSNIQVGGQTASTAAAITATPVFAGIPVRRPAGATPSTIMIQSTRSGLAPREAKTDMSSTRDFADFMRSTGPTDGASLYLDPPKVRRGPQPVRNTEIGPKAPTAGLPAGLRSPTTSTKRKGPKLLARDAQVSDNGTGDLIDFIREGPPGESGAHRIPRNVAPFRTTMDSDDMKRGLGPSSNTNGNSQSRYAPSMNSTQESFKTASGLSSSNSHTGLLASARATNNAVMGGVQEEPQMPTRKSRKPRDPYTVDFSDEEDDDDRMGTPRGGQSVNAGRGGHQREESLVEFLQSQLPPANQGGLSSLGRPIGNGPGMARPKPQARAAAAVGARSSTNDLADFFKNSAPPGASYGGSTANHSNHVSVSSSMNKEKKGGLGGMFRRTRG